MCLQQDIQASDDGAQVNHAPLADRLCSCFTSLLPVRAQEVTPYAIDIPPWFANTFLDLREDIAEATRNGQRLLVYFGQDGCPYCKQLMVTNFSQRSIVEKTRQHFVALAVNMWGDREVTWLDGRVMTEKELARVLKVQFTPTLLFFDEKGKVVARLNGYYPPQHFEPVLDYVAGHLERRQALGDYLRQRVREAARSGSARTSRSFSDRRTTCGASQAPSRWRRYSRPRIARPATSSIAKDCSAPRCARSSANSMWRGSHSAALTPLTSPAGHATTAPGVGARARRSAHPDDRVLRSQRHRSISDRRVSAAVSPRGVVRLCGSRRVPQRAIVSALPAGPRRAPAGAR